MPIPTSKGQYRYVKYEDDGVSCYQCLWCLQTIRIADDPQYWHFCPKCGKSWFHKLQCRDHEVPRWYYDRWGNQGGPPLWEMWPDRPQPTASWVLECRTKWFDQDWGEWREDYRSTKDPLRSDYQWAYSILWQARRRHEDDDDIKFEYRMTLKKDLTSS